MEVCIGLFFPYCVCTSAFFYFIFLLSFLWFSCLFLTSSFRPVLRIIGPGPSLHQNGPLQLACGNSHPFLDSRAGGKAEKVQNNPAPWCPSTSNGSRRPRSGQLQGAWASPAPLAYKMRDFFLFKWYTGLDSGAFISFVNTHTCAQPYNISGQENGLKTE